MKKSEYLSIKSELIRNHSKIKKIIESCENQSQINSCFSLIEDWNKRTLKRIKNINCMFFATSFGFREIVDLHSVISKEYFNLMARKKAKLGIWN
jgi:hypothetical protein